MNSQPNRLGGKMSSSPHGSRGFPCRLRNKGSLLFPGQTAGRCSCCAQTPPSWGKNTGQKRWQQCNDTGYDRERDFSSTIWHYHWHFTDAAFKNVSFTFPLFIIDPGVDARLLTLHIPPSESECSPCRTPWCSCSRTWTPTTCPGSTPGHKQ